MSYPIEKYNEFCNPSSRAPITFLGSRVLAADHVGIVSLI